MLFKITLIVTLLFSFSLHSQRRSDFPYSDKTPNCDLIKKGTFSSNNKTNSRFKVKFHNNKMIEIYGIILLP